jgi:hypothetical protein
LNELSNLEKEKFQIEKTVKLNREIEKLRVKHENEINALQTRMNSTYGEFKRDRAIEFDTMMMRYKNKIKDVENQQKTEIYNISKKKGSSNFKLISLGLNTSVSNITKSKISTSTFSNKK